VAAGQTGRGDLQRAAEKLAQVNARVVGLVLNETKKQAGAYGSTYAYGGTYTTEKPLLPVPAQLNGSASASHRGGSRRAK
jgi:Mrp family chromosome partitioning ATPase